AEFRPQSELQQQFEAKLYSSLGLELPENQEDTANEQTTTSITASTSGQSRQNRSANAANAMADNAENEAVSTQSSADLPSTNERSNGSRHSGSTRTSTSRKNKPSTGSATGTGATTASSTKRSDKPITAASGRLDEKIADDLATKVEQANPDITNFVITDNSSIGKGSLEQKFNDNIAAIQTVHKLDAENRLATPEERQIIARYIGWGGLSNAFDENAKGWEAKAKLLKSLLSEDDYKNAINTVNSAFFTPTTVTRSMWDMVQKLGFKGGLVLEPSVGVGNFLGVSPKGMENKFIGVEYDGITSRIAQHLYPSSTIIHSGYEAMPLADNMFDLVIANPPYGSKKEIFKTKPHLNKFSIHNQFIIGNIENLKPNGIAVIVVTHSFMDAADNSARKLVASMSNLVAAVRLPENTFKENANTSVITDILIFQKFDEATKAQFDEAKIKLFPDWVNSGTLESEDGQPMSFSRYFTKGKGKVIGKVVNTTNQFGGSTFTVKHDGNLKADLAQFVSELPLLIEPNTAKSIAQKAEIDFNNATSHMILGSSNVEVGSVGRNSKGQLTRVIERENEFGGLSLVEEIITPDTVWSKSYSIDANGNYFKLVAALDEKGKPQKVLNKAGKPTNFNVYVRQIVPVDKISTSSKLGERKYKALQALVSMRDLLKEQIRLERYGLEGMERNRKLLAKAYHDFVKPQKEGGYGFINAPYAAAIVNELPDAALLFSLEKSYKKEVKVVTGKDKVGKNIIAVAKPAKATPADILSKQVLNVVSDITRADTIEDALAVSLSQTGKVDIDLIASLLESNADAVIKQLHDSRDNPLAFFDPSLNSWVPREKYLAGNVRQKLNAASNTNLEKNIESLERVLPKTIPIENISLALGMEWIPESVYTKFASYITGDQNTTVKFNHVLKEYAVEAAPTQEKALLFGTERMPPNSLLNHVMNSRSITIRDYVKHSDGSTSSTVNQAQTEAAVTMAETIKNEFLQWIYGQQDIVEQLANVFNHVYNSMVLGKFDGSHLKFVGKVPDEIIKLRKHQIDGIWRGVTNSFVLYDHAVGSGKTFTGIARAIERKRLGLSKKPLMVVPNHMVEQFAADVYRLYPGANVLAAGRKKFTGENRRKLFARIATGDYDLIIVPHSSFSFMSMSSEFEEQFIEKQVDQVVDALREAENSEEGKRGMTVKRLRDLYAKLTSRLEKKRNAIRKDRMITFEEMGIDDITVDEAHEFKNLFYNTNLKGIVGLGQTSGSNKAFDLFMKFQYLHQMGYSGAFMTGTPISNSAVEMHAMMRYLMPNELEQLGLESFDSWQKMFANNTAKFEATESGQLKLKSRFARDWKNMSVLMNSWYTVVDPVTNEDVKRVYKEIEGKDFPLPRVKGGSRQSVVVAPDQYQEMLLAEVLDGFAGLEDISDPKEKAAERFRLFDKAKKLSLDARSVNPIEYADAEGPKIKAVTASVFDLYKKWNKDKGTQIIFLDRSVPKSKGDEKQIKEYDELVNKMEQAERDGDDDLMLEISEKLDKYDSNEINEMRIEAQGGWTAYDEIKRQLIAKGIPADEIAFIHDANNDEEKQALFEKVKSGEVRVLIGNTPRMGAGTNVQDRLVGLHHVDVTWKPSDIEQREGRIIRQGNLLYEKYGHDNFEVVINAYVTERTMDAKLWDINSAKLKTINGIRNYNGEYEMDFGQDADAISMQEIAAIASGDPLMLERVELDAEIQALQREQQQHERRQSSFISQVSKANQQIQTLPTMIKALQDSQKRHDQTYEKVLEKFNSQEITIDGEKFDSRDSAELYVRTKYDSAKQKAGEGEKVSVTYKIDGQNFDSMTRANEYIKNGFAMRQPIEIEYNGQTFNDSTDMMSDMFAQNGDKLPSLFKSDRENAMTINGIPVDIDVDRDGFNFVMYAEDGTTEIQVLGSQYMHFKDATALRVANLINAIAKGLSKLDQKIAEYEQRLQSAKDVVKGVSDKIGQAFAKQDVLDAKKERLESVLSQLKAENSNDTKEDGPLYSRNTKGNSGSTVQQVRGVLIDRFGKDTIK
ncbi:MAG: N-6 DNA methylase, partial [Acinetobacter sp.]